MNKQTPIAHPRGPQVVPHVKREVNVDFICHMRDNLCTSVTQVDSLQKNSVKKVVYFEKTEWHETSRYLCGWLGVRCHTNRSMRIHCVITSVKKNTQTGVGSVFQLCVFDLVLWQRGKLYLAFIHTHTHTHTHCFSLNHCCFWTFMWFVDRSFSNALQR